MNLLIKPAILFAAAFGLVISAASADDEIKLSGKDAQSWKYMPEEEGLQEACFIPLPFVSENYLCGEDVLIFPARATVKVITNALAKKAEDTVVIDGVKYAAKVFTKSQPTASLHIIEPFHFIPKHFEKAILKTTPEIRKDGYKMFKMAGEVNNPKTSKAVKGVFEIGMNKKGVIDHIVFRPL